MYSGAIGGDADQHIVMSGAGTKKITHVNNYPGDTKIDSGVLSVPKSGSLGSGGTIDLGSDYFITTSAKIQLSEATGDQVLTNDIHVRHSDSNTEERRTIESLNTSGTATYLGAISHTNAGENLRLYVTSGGTLALSNTVSGAGHLWMQQEGTVKLAGNNTYSGGTSLDRGTAYLTHNNAAGSGTVYLGAESDMGVSPTLKAAAGLTITNNITSRPTPGDNVSIETDTGSSDVTLSGTLTLTKDAQLGASSPVTYVNNKLSSGSVVINTLSLGHGGDSNNENRFLVIEGPVTVKAVIDPPTADHRGLVMRQAPGKIGTLTLNGNMNANFFLDSGNVIWGSDFSLGESAKEFQVGTTDNTVEADKNTSVAFTKYGVYVVDFTVGFLNPTEGVTGTRLMEFKHDSGTITLDGKVTLKDPYASGKYLYLSNIYPVEVTGSISGPAGIRKQGIGYLTYSGMRATRAVPMWITVR